MNEMYSHSDDNKVTFRSVEVPKNGGLPRLYIYLAYENGLIGFFKIILIDS